MCPFSAYRSATRCAELPCSARSRFGVFSSSARPARPRTFEGRGRPCGFPLCEYDAVKLDVRTWRLRFREVNSRRVPRRLNVRIADSITSSIVTALMAPRRIRVRSRSATTRHIKRLRFVNSPDRNSHASPLSLGRCSATGSDPSQPGQTSGPSLSRPAALLGFHRRPSQVCSRTRVADRFRSSRAHLPVRPVARPDAFSSG